MMQWHLLYLFLTFSIGMTTLGIATVIYFKTRQKLVCYYLYFHLAFTLLVILRMFSLYFHTSLPGIHPSLVAIMNYVESFIAVYALMFTTPVFCHELFAFPHVKTRNAVIAAIIIVTYGVDHALDFAAPNETFRQIGHMLDESVLIAIILYSVIIGGYYSRRIQEPARKRFATRFLVLIGIFLPGIIVDIGFRRALQIRVFPILYSGLSIMFTCYLIPRTFNSPEVLSQSGEGAAESLLESSQNPVSREELFQHYTISSREQEVVRLLLEGCSNQDIGDTLCISLNTVKTHLRKIYAKCDVKSRYELMSLFKKAR